jgi:hypothetical protein
MPDFADFPSEEFVDGQWQSNLTELEEWYWKGMQEFRAQGPVRLHLTYRCDSQQAASALVGQLEEYHAESINMVRTGDAGPPQATIERLRALSIEAAQSGATVRILSNSPGWRVRALSPTIGERQELTGWFAIMRVLATDGRWHIEGSGIGP